MTYRNKPVVIEAVQWTGKNVHEMLEFAGTAAHDIYELPDGTYTLEINILGLRCRPDIGDYIYKISDEGFGIMLPKSFEDMYEPIEESDSIDTLDYYKNKLYIRDADESKSHLRNSLNAVSGSCFRMAAACGKDGLCPVSNKQLETLGYYLVRAQAVITYLREEVNQLKEEKTK